MEQAGKRKVWKRVWAFVLSVALIFGLSPENSFVVHAQEEGEACICTELCTEGSVNADCPVCAAEGADIGLCEGTEVTEPDEIEPEKTESEEPGSKAANAETADKIITAWQWVDEEEILDPETGSLALPGASQDVPALFADVTNLLPTEIKAVLKVTVQNGATVSTDNEGDETAADRGEAAVEEVEQTVALGKWECADYPEAGAYSGSYTFTASLPEGYRLNDRAAPLDVTVELGGAKMYEAANGVSYVDEGGVEHTTTGNVTTVENGMASWGSGWYYVNQDTTISSRIEVSGDVHLILGDGYTLTASSGIRVSAWNSLTIYGQSGGTGTLTATAAASSANSAIGGNAYEAAGTIVINGGNVNATALKDAATGIGGGGGDGGKAGTITINGGTVNATGSYWNAGIGGGTNEGAGNITINGGIITAQSGGSGNSGGIGCASSGDGGSITINGGTITATGAHSGIGGEGFQNYSTTKSTFIVNGGSINGTLSSITPKNNESKEVRLGKLDVSEISSINSVSVDGKPYYIEAKHSDNDYLYLYMVSGVNHAVTIRDDAGTITKWTATYDSGGDRTKGYFTFQQEGTGGTSTYETTLAFDRDAYAVNLSEAKSLNVTVTVADSTQTNSLRMSLRRIAMDSMSLSVMQGEKTVKEYTKSGSSPYTFSVDVSQLTVGDYTLKAVYGGSSDGAEGSEQTAALTICKTLDSPQSLAWSSENYGRATWNAVEHATGYSVQLYKDGTAVGAAVSTTEQSYNFTITEVGNYTFKVKAIGNGTHYFDSREVTSSSLIRKQAQITVESGKSTYTKIYGDPAFDLEGISHDNTDANVKLGYTVNNSKNAAGASVNDNAVVTVDENGLVTIQGVGTATVTVSLPESTHFAAAESVDITIEVKKRAVVLQSGSSVIKQDASLTYGESLSELSLNEAAVFVAEGTNTVVEGTPAWEAPDTKPTSAGTKNFRWKFIPNDDNYEALSDSVEITVKLATPKITWDTTDQNAVYTGNEINSGKLKEPTVELTNGEAYDPSVEGTSPITYSFRPSGSTESYTTGLPTAIGTYEVKAGVAAFGNYAAAESTNTMTLTINWLQGVQDATLQDQGGVSLFGDSWWAQTVKLIAPEKYQIGLTDAIGNDTTIEYQTETGKTGEKITYYLKNGDGEIAKKEVTVYVDRTAPKGSITIKNTTWDQLLSTITFGFYVPKNEVVTVSASDMLSGVKTTEYVISGDPYTEISNVQALSGWQNYSADNKPAITNTDAESYVYVRITDQAGNITYLSSAGILADDSKPTDTNISTSAVTDSTATVTVTASDTGSGVAAYYLYYTADSTKTVTADTVKSTGTANEAGVFSLSGLQTDKTYYLYAVAEDRIGNLSEVKTESFSTALSGFTVTCSATADSITVTPLENQEKYGTVMYRLGTGGTWQASNKFTGLSADTTYTVYAKYTGNDVYSESCAKDATVKTKKWAVVTEPTGLIATYGDTLNDIELPSNWTWTSADTKVAVGEQQYAAKFTQKDTESFDYSKIEGFDADENCVYRTLTVTVSKADPEIGRVTVTPETVSNTTAVTAVTLSRANETVPGELKLDESVLSYSDETGKEYHWTFTPTDAANYETKHGTVSIKVEDTIAPTAEYRIGMDDWKKFVNTITFGLFCKDYKTVEIAYSDLNGNEEEGSGLKTKQYYISDRELSDADIQSIQWKDYTKALSLDAQGVYFIYMKVVDNAGHTVIQNSEGIVIYEDSTPAAADLTYTYQENADKTVSVTLNGNTVKDIKNGTDVLTKDMDYTVVADGTITFKAAYLQTLSAGDYTITVSYNPQGKEYQTGGLNESPNTTAIALKVAKADAPAIQDVDRNYVYAAGSRGETVSIDIAALLPEDRGTTTYALAENDAPYVVDEAVDRDGKLTYQVSTEGRIEDVTTLTVTATTKNYKDITVNINIILTDKYVTAEKAGAEVCIDGSDELTYGQKLGEISLNTDTAKFVVKDTETQVTGRLAWTNPDEVLDAGTSDVQWTFTPDDQQTYEVLTGKVTIIVNKKAPEIVWDATALTIGYTGYPVVSGQLPKITVTLVNGEEFDAAENPIHYSYRKSGSTGDFTEGLPAEVGTYEVKAGIAAFGNYADAESTDTMALTIDWLQNMPDAILKDQDEVVLSGNSWWARSISLTAPENYTISTDLTGAYGASIAYQEETGTDGAEVTYYLKNDAGEIAEKKTVVRIDQTAPTGSITIKNTIWDSLLKVITVGFYVPKNEVVTISSSDTRSGVQKTEYVISGEAYTSLTDVQGLTGWQDYRADNKPKLTDTSGENYVYARITDNAGNAIYVSSDGVLVDDVAPTDVSIAASEITQNSATVTVTADDAGSGVSSYYLYYTVDHAADVTVDMIKDSDITNTTGSFSLSGLKDNTTYSVYAVAEDHIGNCSEIATESFKTKAKAYENSSGGGSSGNSAGMPSGDEKPKSEDDSASKDQPDEKTQTENALVMNKTAKLTWKNDVFAIKWGTVENADGYDIYATTCGKKFTSKSKVASVTEEQTSATIEEVLGSQVSSTRGYKVMVKAYRMADGKKQYLGKSMEFYTVGSGHKTYTNASAITPSVRTLTLTTGKTKKVSATITKEDKKKKLLPGKYTASKRYFTADETIATVDEKGNVTALKKGKTTLYIKAANGVTAKVQIIIK